MVGPPARRTTSLWGLAVAGAGAWTLSTLSDSFVASRALRKNRFSSTSMRGFKEDFEKWRGELTPEEAKESLEAARGEFDKKFRKSDKWSMDTQPVSEDKIKSFGEILSKFLDNEKDDYWKAEKERVMKPPGLRSAVKDKVFKLRPRVVEIDRDADRRYAYVTRKTRESLDAGGPGVIPCSPQRHWQKLQNNDTESHESLVKAWAHMREVRDILIKEAPEDKEKWETAFADFKKDVPPIGEICWVEMYRELQEMLEYVSALSYEVAAVAEMPTQAEFEADIAKNKDEWAKNGWVQKAPASEAEAREATRENLNLWLTNKLTKEFYAQMWKVEDVIDTQKKVYASQYDAPGKTKADVLKELHAALLKVDWVKDKNHKLDEDILEKLSKFPVARPGDVDFKNPFGYASKLYKSEAVDAWGVKYLLGVYENPDDALKAFDQWNAEYEKARVKQNEELAEWSKQETARVDKENARGKERMAKILEEVEAENAAR